MNQRIIKKICECYSENGELESKVSCTMLDKLLEKHFPNSGYSEKAEAVTDDIVDIILIERENAFSVGFRAAVSLWHELFDDR